MILKKSKTANRGLFIFFGGFFSLVGLLFFFRNVILFYGIQLAFAYFEPQSQFTFEKVEWHGNELVFSHVSIKQGGWELESEALRVVLDFDFKKRVFQPQLIFGQSVGHLPAVSKIENKTIPLLSFGATIFQPKVSVDHGRVEIGNQTYFVSITANGQQEGSLILSDKDASASFMQGSWKKETEGLFIELHATHLPLQFCSIMSSSKYLDAIDGAAALDLSAEIDSYGKFISFHFSGEFEDLYWKDPLSKAACFVKKTELEIHQSGMTPMHGHLIWEGGKSRFDGKDAEPLMLSQVSGHLNWMDQELPTGRLEGSLYRGGLLQPFHVEVVEERLGSWLGRFSFQDRIMPQIECEMEQIDHALVVKASLNSVGPDLMELAQEGLSYYLSDLMQWEISEGGMSGQVELAFQKPSLVSVEKLELVGEGFKFHHIAKEIFGSLETAFLQGSLSFCDGKLNVKELDVCFEKGTLDLVQDNGEIWNCSHLIGRFSMQDKLCKPSFIQGSFLGVEGQIDFLSPQFMERGRFAMECSLDQLIGLVSQDFADLFHTQKDIPVVIEGQFNKTETAHLIEAACHVGAEKQEHLDVKSLWKQQHVLRTDVRGNCSNLSLFHPLFQQVFSRLDIAGDLSFNAQVVGSNLLVVGSVDQLVCSSKPSDFIMKASKQTPVHLEVDLSQGVWQAKIPLATQIRAKSKEAFFEGALIASGQGGDLAHSEISLHEGKLSFERLATDMASQGAIQHLEDQKHPLTCDKLTYFPQEQAWRGRGVFLGKNQELVNSSFQILHQEGAWSVGFEPKVSLPKEGEDFVARIQELFSK